MRRRSRGAVIFLAGALVLAAAVPPVVATDSAPTGGRAASTGTLIELRVGGSILSFSVDSSLARRGRDAVASLIVGATDSAEIGHIAAETDKAGTRRSTLGAGALNLVGAGVFNVADSEVVATLDDDERAVSRVVTSVVGATLAAVASSGVVNQQVETVAGGIRSRAVRSIELADLQVLSVGQLLDALGLGLLSLPCADVAALATELGAPATDACDQLNGLVAQLDAGIALLTNAEATAQTLRDTTQPLRDAQAAVVDGLADTVATLTAQRDALLTQASGLDRTDLETALADLEAEIAAIQPLCTNLGLLCDTLATLTAQAATVTGQLALLDDLDAAQAALATAAAQLAPAQDALDALDATLAQALAILDALDAAAAGGQPTCGDATAALAQAGALVPALAGAADTISGALDAACTDLFGELDALLDTPLLSMSGVEVLLEATSAKGAAVTLVDGTIGSLTVGALPPTAQNLEIDDRSALETAAGDIAGSLDAVLSTLGFVAPALDVELLRATRSTTVDPDGSSRANAGLSLLYVNAPATPTNLPAAPPFGPLAGLLPEATGPSGSVNLPTLQLNAGRFTAASSFPVASVNAPPPGGGGGQGGGGLPLTGVEHRFDLAALLLLLANLIRRRLAEAR